MIAAPSPSIPAPIRRYAAILYEDVVQAVGQGAITSWARAIAPNARVGGHPDSQHLLGWAVDVAPRYESQLRARLRYRWVLVPEGDHVHVQMFAAGVATPWVRAYRR